MQILIVVLCVCSPPSPNPNFVVTQKRPPKERETENQVADGGKGMKEREVEGEEDGLEDNKKYIATNVAEKPATTGSMEKAVVPYMGPEPSTNLLFTGITDTTVSVSWTKPRGPVTGFKVTYTHTREGEPVSVSVGASDTAVDLSQLTPGSSYEVNIISLLNLDESDPLKDTVQDTTYAAEHVSGAEHGASVKRNVRNIVGAWSGF
ncbi:hypothetical protein ACEWY4_024578 [Coilia grayii]|uniref:Fibronectin type-III domain-containing protein n=1 Tax=Coilia grayii TaxID=363190 RepID=A0ABD1IW38_9TELE